MFKLTSGLISEISVHRESNGDIITTTKENGISNTLRFTTSGNIYLDGKYSCHSDELDSRELGQQTTSKNKQTRQVVTHTSKKDPLNGRAKYSNFIKPVKVNDVPLRKCIKDIAFGTLAQLITTVLKSPLGTVAGISYTVYTALRDYNSTTKHLSVVTKIYSPDRSKYVGLYGYVEKLRHTYYTEKSFKGKKSTESSYRYTVSY